MQSARSAGYAWRLPPLRSPLLRDPCDWLPQRPPPPPRPRSNFLGCRCLLDNEPACRRQYRKRNGYCERSATTGRRSNCCCEACNQRCAATLPASSAPDDADDILQDVLVIVSRKLYWLEQPELFRALVVSHREPGGLPLSEEAPALVRVEPGRGGARRHGGAGGDRARRHAAGTARQRALSPGQPRGAGAALSRRDAARPCGGGPGDSDRHREVEARVRPQDLVERNYVMAHGP